MKNIYTPKKKMFKTTATILRGRGSSWVFLIGTFNKVSRLFSDRLQCGPKKSIAGSTHLQNSGFWGRRQVAKNGRIEVVRCLVEICPPLPGGQQVQYSTRSGGPPDAFLPAPGGQVPCSEDC